MIARRDEFLSLWMKIYRLAWEAIPGAEGNELLALHEAIVYCIDGFLAELGSHGLQNRLSWDVAPDKIDIGELLQEYRASYQEARRLRASGFKSGKVIGAYMTGWTYPIGSPSWRNTISSTFSNDKINRWMKTLGGENA
ncbi:MAG: hypothetical protein JXA20_06865 [Spirochaetes bacterium]|nr:hypothetical protein [Spirochaetota bacterium]